MSNKKPASSLPCVPAREGCRLSFLLFPLAMIIVLSTVLLVLAAIFLGNFRIQLLTLASNNFIVTPILMILASGLSILLAIVSFIVLLKKQLKLYLTLACISMLVFFLQTIAVILSFIVIDNVDSDINKVNVAAELSKAAQDVSAMAVWDALQIRYACCGGRGNRGYSEWESHLNGTYPDSCCTVRYTGCGHQASRTQAMYERIHTRGCITTIKQSLEEHVVPLLLAWGAIGIVVVLAELVVILLCLLFSWNQRQLAAQQTMIQLQGESDQSDSGKWEERPLRYTSTCHVHLR